ncbi:MAG: amidohydrolase family protein [Microbacterium sp.]
MNPLINPDRIAGAIAPTEAVVRLLDAGVSPERLTMSTDGNASVPRVLPGGDVERFSFQLGLLTAVRDVVDAGVLPLADAVALVTANPARALRLDDAGGLAVGRRADIVCVDERLEVRTVLSAGRIVVRDGRALSPSAFQDPRWGR